MSFRSVTLTILIASPGDTADAREAVEDVAHSWNSDRARQTKVVLLPLRWETDAIPELGRGDTQTVINNQFANDADIVIGLFHSRLGSPTKRAASGTAEEIDKSVERGARVHVYFSETPITDRERFDINQYQALQEFKATLTGRGLLGSYASLEDLRAKVRTALEYDVHHLVDQTLDANQSAPEPSGAILRATHEYDREPHQDSRGKVKMRNRRHRITVENTGSAPADDVDITIESRGQGEPPMEAREGRDGSIRVLPGSSYAFPIYLSLGTAPNWDVTVNWSENGEQHSERQSVSIY